MPATLEPPAAPPAPAPTSPEPSSAAATPTPTSSESFDAAFPDDGLDSPTPAPKPEGKLDTPAPAKPKEEPAAPKPEPEPKKADAPAKEPEGGEYEPPKVAKSMELRSWATRMAGRAKKAETELSQLKAEVQQLKARPPVDDGKTAALAQQLAAVQKEAQEYRQQLRSVAWQKDPEFQDKYVKPRMAAVKDAYREISELTAFEPDPDGVEEPKQRPATSKDFDEIYFAPNTTAAITLAKQRFGDAWLIALEHRKTIRRLMEAENTASQEWAKTSEERENARTAEDTKRGEAMVQMFGLARESYIKRNPEMFTERDGDAEGNELLAKATQFADAVFGGNQGLSPQQIVMRDARAYNWLRSYPRLQRDLKVARAEVDELKKTIDGLRGSAPGKTSPAPDTKPKEEEGWESAFDRTVK